MDPILRGNGVVKEGARIAEKTAVVQADHLCAKTKHSGKILAEDLVKVIFGHDLISVFLRVQNADVAVIQQKLTHQFGQRTAVDAAQRLYQRFFVHVNAVKHFHADGVFAVRSDRYGRQNWQNDRGHVAKDIGRVLRSERADFEPVLANGNVSHFHTFQFHIGSPPQLLGSIFPTARSVHS